MNIQPGATILAPAALHLDLYRVLCQENQGTLSVQVLTLDSFLHQFVSRIPTVQTLFDARDALKQLPEDNVFHASAAEPDFLKAAVRFCQSAVLYDAKRFPQETRKEKDLLEVLDLLSALDLEQKHLAEWIKTDPQFDNLWILNTESNETDAFWKQFLLDHGAKLLESDGASKRISLSAANGRKCAEAAALEIVNGSLDAQNVLCAAASSQDAQALAQIFDAFHIPYTLLHPLPASRIPAQFAALIRHLGKKTRASWLEAVRVLFPDSGSCVLEYFDKFASSRSLQDISYEDNPLISPELYAAWQNLEQDAKTWMQAHAFLDMWTLDNLEDAAALIQQLHPEPNQEDLDAFDACLNVLSVIQPRLKTEEDALLAASVLDGQTGLKGCRHMEGVLIGTRQDISMLRPVVFLTGVHSKTFPAYHLASGIFDEAYLLHSDWPALADRLGAQEKQLKSVLDQPETLYALVPQSDYTGKSLDQSRELNDWMQDLPKFVSIPDVSSAPVPDFTLPASQVFSQRAATANSLRTFQTCPFRHYLRYGLKIKKSYEQDLDLGQRFYSHVLLQARRLENRTWKELTEDSLRPLVEDAFSFAWKVLENRHLELSALIDVHTHALARLLPVLRLFETERHLDLINQTAQIDPHFNRQLSGTLDPYSDKSMQFSVLDGNDVAAAFTLDINQKAAEYVPVSLNRRKNYPEAVEKSPQDVLERTSADVFVKGFTPMDLKADDDELLAKAAKRKTFEEKEEEMAKTLGEFLESLEKPDVQAVHKSGACTNCAYKGICRNGSEEQK
jgi:hypothetical protein